MLAQIAGQKPEGGGHAGAHEAGAAPRALALPDQPVAENILFADNGKIAGLEPCFNTEDSERDFVRFQRKRLRQARYIVERLQSLLGEHRRAGDLPQFSKV